MVTEDAVDLALHQHLLAQVRLHVGDVDLAAVDLGELAQGREQLERAVVGGAAEGLALEILRRLDRAVRLHRHGEGRLVEHHIDRDRRVVRLLGRQLDQRVDIAEPDIVGAVGDQGNGGARTVALIERDLEPLGFEVAAVVSQEEHPLRALILPVQH
jgi:hypothetical protein